MDGIGTDTSVRCKIRNHLKAHTGEVTEYDAPRALTGEGIATALGMTPRQAAAAISVLSERGLIAKYRRHVDGYRQRKVVYLWATSGDGSFADLRIEEVTEIRGHIRMVEEILDRTNHRGRRGRDSPRYNNP